MWRARAHPRSRGENRFFGTLPPNFAAHPRSRGENPSTSRATACVMGSSPLTRGKLLVGAGDNLAGGLIPAHAGKTSTTLGRRLADTAHPRSRGENACTHPARRAGRGSSPLTRGKPLLCVAALAGCGLIPAHAGKTVGSVGSAPVGTAHPRSRGENKALVRPMLVGPGSSPLTRGKRRRALAARDRDGLIPAHAGKTPDPQTKTTQKGAHPRSRGENVRVRRMSTSRRGSSPLTRGKQQGRRRKRHVPGLIPAHAGKTICAPLCLRRCEAHPRSRGENSGPCRAPPIRGGSSPLTRGKPDRAAGPGQILGLIPAHAGKTSTSNRRTTPGRAHPRSRGENDFDGARRPASPGSSPLTRGKLALCR